MSFNHSEILYVLITNGKLHTGKDEKTIKLIYNVYSLYAVCDHNHCVHMNIKVRIVLIIIKTERQKSLETNGTKLEACENKFIIVWNRS